MNRSNCLLFIFSLFLFLLPLTAPAGGVPKILVPQTEWDFGKMPLGGIVSHKYWIENQGTKVLRIIRVRPGCGCTKAPLTEFFIPPNDSTQVELLFNSTYYPGTSKRGATIISSDSVTGEVQLDFFAEVLANFDTTYPLRIFPYSLIFKPNLLKQEVKIENVGEKKLKLQVVDSPYEFYDAQLTKKELSSGKSCKLKIRNKKGLPIENSFKSITLEATSDTTYRFTLPLRWIGWDEK